MSQWNTRPEDQCYDTLPALRDAAANRRAISYERAARADQWALRTEGQDLVLFDRRNPAGGALLSHYAFTQLCARAKAPSGFLRTMPAEMASNVLGWALERQTEKAETKVLLAKDGGPLPRVRALTSGGYGRIWDLDVVDVTSQATENGSPWQLATSGLSDRGLFIFLIHTGQTVQLPGDERASWRHGIAIQNSETGRDMFEVLPCLYNPLTDTRLPLPGKPLRIRHNRRAPMRFLQEAQPKLAELLATPVAAEVRLIERARNRVIADSASGVRIWLQRRGFGLTTIAAVEGTLTGTAPTLWEVEQALLGAARTEAHMDERIALERKAAKLFTA